MNVCRSVAASNFQVDSSNAKDDFIGCVIVTKNATSLGNTNQMIKFELEGFRWNPSVWIAPNNKGVIELSPIAFGPDDDPYYDWRLHLEYHDTTSVPYNYGILIHIDSLITPHYEMTDTYDGWKSTGDIGGFVFLMVIMHIVVMFFGRIRRSKRFNQMA